MTKLRIMSDLHTEFGPIDPEPIGEDILILAGDIGVGAKGAEWAHNYAHQHNIPTVMIAGNHEFYHHDITTTTAALRAMSDNIFHFLERDYVFIKHIKIIGTTLWTNYDLYHMQNASMAIAAHALNDHLMIEYCDGYFMPPDALAHHALAVEFLGYQTANVVVTHHLPSAKSIAPQYLGDPVNPAFASNLDNMVASSGAALWVHGHTHVSNDYQIGDTRILCNPRGYYPSALNPDFNPNLIVEV